MKSDKIADVKNYPIIGPTCCDSAQGTTIIVVHCEKYNSQEPEMDIMSGRDFTLFHLNGFRNFRFPAYDRMNTK